ncbi:focadhesin-like [Pomacea canaliculata]|uniref:focadhesin-like n=1 Tax=Pomacea canaliculata TaxID=400727 RepID=UPI000D73831B|nr:focadhesin-like [Pomacea canaliculata]XP_025076792.1 focadhesin-like [Pomacea canaliculata]XP_025076793.1 focadhesin-like [Pomacea canaliculata]
MEDIRKRLEFGNPFIQEQAIWKLFGEISRKKLTDKITIQTPEIPELKLLWDIVTGDKDTLALTAGQALLQLVLSQTADFNYVLNGILNLIPSARSLGGLVSTLGELLVLQALVMQEAAEDHVYRCPHTLRSPTHPFITVLTNRPSSWQLLLAQVEDICLHRDSRVRKLSDEILRPFLKFRAAGTVSIASGDDDEREAAVSAG